MPALARLPRKPEARTEKVEDLVARVREGQVRVPVFQRGLNWDSRNVAELFDSLYRGFPIGSLLFYKKPAEAARIEVGPLAIEAPEVAEAWWVVDGQQRVTALAACLTRNLPLATRRQRNDPYVLYFDVREQTFTQPPTSGPVPSTWVPVPQLLDATRLAEWVFRWQHREDEELRRTVFEAGTRLREYPIPLYLIEGAGVEVARELFYRTNQAGRPLEWREVHKALFGGAGPSPSTLAELADDLLDVGMGRLEEDRLLTCLIALRGLDPTRDLAEHYRRDPNALREAVHDALPVLRGVLSFLRRDAGIPHRRLLPKSILLDVLVRFFGRHPNPSARSRTLLSRWLWRTILGASSYDDRTLRRRGIALVGEDEEDSVQNLLGLNRRERSRPPELPETFDARADASRILLLALAHKKPRDLTTGRRIDIAQLLEEEGKDAFKEIVRTSGKTVRRNPANLAIHPRPFGMSPLLDHLASSGSQDPVLASHAVDAEAARRLAEEDLEGFLRSRAEALTREVRAFADRMAAWDYNDRPSVEHLLAEVGIAR